MVYVRESNPPLHSGYPGTRYAHPGIKIQLSFNHTNHVLPISPICLGCNHAQKIRNWNDPPLPVLVYEHRYKCKSSILYIYIYIYILCIYIYVYIYIYIHICMFSYVFYDYHYIQIQTSHLGMTSARLAA